MRYCLIVALSLLVGGCSEQGAASQDPNAPVKVEISQMYMTVRNTSGLALNELSVTIVPVGRMTTFSKFLGRLENTESRDVMLGEFFGATAPPSTCAR